LFIIYEFLDLGGEIQVLKKSKYGFLASKNDILDTELNCRSDWGDSQSVASGFSSSFWLGNDLLALFEYTLNQKLKWLKCWQNACQAQVLGEYNKACSLSCKYWHPQQKILTPLPIKKL
jgi:hypothetical protein